MQPWERSARGKVIAGSELARKGACEIERSERVMECDRRSDPPMAQSPRNRNPGRSEAESRDLLAWRLAAGLRVSRDLDAAVGRVGPGSAALRALSGNATEGAERVRESDRGSGMRVARRPQKRPPDGTPPKPQSRPQRSEEPDLLARQLAAGLRVPRDLDAAAERVGPCVCRVWHCGLAGGRSLGPWSLSTVSRL